MHSIFSISARRTSITRPARSGSSAPGGRSATSVEIRWLAQRSAKCSSQNCVMAVSTRPLCGMGSAITTSNADMRSEVTNSSRPSPAS